MNILELDSYNLADAVKFNEQLNPRIWQGNRMRPQVRAKLLKIAEDFKQSLGLSDLEVKDITVSGSNAGYTYTPNSDIDLHLVVDIPQADSSEVYRELFDAKKFQYNETHNIKIGGYDVELYVENANTPPVSQGMFSVLRNDWINIPLKKRSTVNDTAVKSKYDVIKHRIESAIASGNFKRLSKTAAKIKKMRQAGLDKHGELGPENIAYKMLRSQGIIEQLYNARVAAKDKELSLRERTIQVKKPFRYGFRTTEDVSSNPSGVSPDTQMFLNEKPAQSVQEIVTDFVNYCVEQLSIEQLPTIKFKRDPEWSARNKTFGRYNHETNLLEVSLAGRHVMDILRTVAHELTHQRQHEVSVVPGNAGETGSPWENEANARAGVLMREYAEQHPEYFADGQIEEGLKNKKPQSNDELSRAQISRIAHPLSRDPALAYTQKFAQSHYPTLSNDPDEAFNKLLQRGMMHGKEADIIHDKKIVNLEKQIADLRKALSTMNAANGLSEASGYIPTKKQAKDPRYSMALTKDVRPGAVGKEANKLGLKTNSQGKPALLMKTANTIAESLATELALFEDDLFEIKMTGKNLASLAKDIKDVRVGLEFEMIVPNVSNDDEENDLEPDYDQDESVTDIDDAVNFFDDGDYNSSRELRSLRENMQEEFWQWQSEQIDNEWHNSGAGFEFFMEFMNREYPYDRDDGFESAEQYVRENNPDLEPGTDAYSEAVSERLNEQESQYYTEEWESQGRGYNYAQEEFEEQQRDEGDYAESDWLESEGISDMRDVSNRYDITWPHYTSSNSGDAETDIENVALDFMNAMGMDTVAISSSYHGSYKKWNGSEWVRIGNNKPDDAFTIEPDGSLSGDNDSDTGLEFVSPPIPLEDIGTVMKKVQAWAGQYGAYTGLDNKTSMHTNISVPGYDISKLDYVKAALLLGDEYVLREFERFGNSYAKPAIEKVRQLIKQKPEQAQQLLDKMKSQLNAEASKLIHSGTTDKFTSINTKDNRIEFRSPGGDYLSDIADNPKKLIDTINRMVVTMDAAMDPNKYKQEYQKKLYKLLTGQESGREAETGAKKEMKKDDKDLLNIFSRYAAGELPRAALKSFVRQAQLERKVAAGKETGQMWWDVSWGNGRVEVVANNKKEAVDTAFKESYWAPDQPDTAQAQQFRNSLVAKPLRPYEEKPAEEPAQQDQGNWGIWMTGADRFANQPGSYARGETPPLYRFPTQAAADRWIEQQRADRPNMRADIEVREIEPAEPVPGSTLDLQRQRAAQASQGVDTSVDYELYNRTTGEIIDTFPARNDDEARVRLDDFRNFSAQARQNPDLDVGVRRGPGVTNAQTNTNNLRPTGPGPWEVANRENNQVYYNPGHTQRAAAETEARTWLTLNSHNPEDFVVRTRQGADAAQGGLVDVAGNDWDADFERSMQQSAQAAQTLTRPGQGQQVFTGEWKVLVNGEEVYRFGGVGNNQGDANGVAARWLRNNGMGVSGEGFEVYPVMGDA